MKRRTLCVLAIFGIGAVLGTAAWLQPGRPAPVQPSSCAELSALSEPKIARVDIARMNLLCAEGLWGASEMDVNRSLELLDQWSRTVRAAEQRYWNAYLRDPTRYDGSPAKFKAVNLALTLKQELGCGYDTDLVTSGLMSDLSSTRFFRDSRNLFLHGFVERRRGSCASLPVLMVAVGRRCGYPLHLVACKGHLLCRWDDGQERFNIETAVEGVDSKPDAHYRQWPHAFTETEGQAEKYLKNLTPWEELGVFLQIRAACLQEHGRFEEAAQAYTAALRSFPDSALIKAYLNRVKGI